MPIKTRLLRTSSCLLGAALSLSACQSQQLRLHAADDVEPTVPILTGGQARNIILFIGDGMGISTITAARIFAGQRQGRDGESYQLSFEQFPNVALSKTYNTDLQVPDSAGTMSAMMTGSKTRGGVIAVQAEPLRGDCAGSIGNGATTLLELAETSGMSTGVVTTARLTHATPAATYAHVPHRAWEADSDLPDQAVLEGCRDIARQLIEFPFGDGLELAFGGGRRAFLPAAMSDPEYPEQGGVRIDQRNLAREWTERPQGGRYVMNTQQFRHALAQGTEPLLALFEPSHMQYEHDRDRTGTGEPSLAEMTRAAIARLQQHDIDKRKGFFLVVEGGRIDHAHHETNAFRALTETIALSDAVEAALNATNPDNTLIIVTADHSHVFTIAGYPRRGNPILGLVQHNQPDGSPSPDPDLAADGQPYTTLGYANGPHFDAEARHNLTTDQAQHPDFQQPVGYPTNSETHGGEDVAVFAIGPGAQRIHGVLEQNRIFHAMMMSNPQLKALWKKINRAYGWPVDPQIVLEKQIR